MTLANEVSSRELMEEIVTRAALISIQKIRDANRNNDNLILRDLKAIHGNTTKEDLPEYLQKEIQMLVQSMFGYINHKGYVLVPKESVKR